MNSRNKRKLAYRAKNEKKPTLHMIFVTPVGDYLSEEFNHKEDDRIKAAIKGSTIHYTKRKYTKKYADGSQKVNGYKLRPVKQEQAV